MNSFKQRHAEKVPWDQIGHLKFIHEYQDPYIKGVGKDRHTDIIENKAFWWFGL
jgi:phosphomannomutase/phosphoglucomutase